ncbi:putative membrane protein [Thioalkalivibrio sp. ALE21]|uniref:TMEM165/GDT1 family protein n=1 Tax=Thioalkalivibrio sp. ALE21 TaxID=1158175 RepID=UPI000D81ED4E|nr:TMEM165/GDT1 family protein [Thioalkalivibrio sp. ALE21]PYG01464.1 putative membrane protein [Thioalkalivibrio sp. ALE21]
MELFLLSVLTMAVAEIGDRSMFLAALFGLRCHRLWPVFWGMTAGLFANQLVSAVASGSLVPVVLGATLGILLITVPGLLLGRRFAERMPVHTLRWFAAALFLLIGLWSLLEALGWMPDLGLPDFSGALLEAAGRSAE